MGRSSAQEVSGFTRTALRLSTRPSSDRPSMSTVAAQSALMHSLWWKCRGVGCKGMQLKCILRGGLQFMKSPRQSLSINALR